MDQKILLLAEGLNPTWKRKAKVYHYVDPLHLDRAYCIPSHKVTFRIHETLPNDGHLCTNCRRKKQREDEFREHVKKSRP